MHHHVSTTRAAATTLAPAPYTDRHVRAGALNLHYLDYGTAGRPVILCVHGGAAHGHWFDFVAADFRRDHHVLAIDQRGHGESDWADPPAYAYADYAADLDKAARVLDLRDFTLIGHSMGGTVSTCYTARYPGRVKRLIVVDTSISLGEDRLAAMRERGSRPGTDYASREELISRFQLRPGTTLASPEVVRYVAGFSAKQFPDGAWRHRFDRRVYGTREKFDGMPLWGDIKVPALLVKGGRSERITPAIQAAVKARCPQVELAEVPDADHHVTLDNPAGFAAAVRGFLQRHP
ncbi:MAG: alpha/beta hydrolase [Burkholderiales bacterium]|nr:alpha/beta hydrolase [Burkholderiales bacterium]